MAYHIIKLSNQYFDAVASGDKNFEVRYNDRNYQIGDTLVLMEINNQQELTKRVLIKEVSYVLEKFSGLKEGWCVLGLTAMNKIMAEELLDLLKDVSANINPEPREVK